MFTVRKQVIIRILLGGGAVIAILIGIVLLATIFGGIDLVDFNTGIAVSLIFLVLGIGYWTLKPHIERYVNQKADNDAKREKKSQQELVTPVLKFGGIVVRSGSQFMHGGVYDSKNYYVEVVNIAPSTVAKNCRGSISMIGPEIVTIWEKGRSETIDIGHREFLCLFRTSVFRKGSHVAKTKLYFYAKEGIDIVNETAERRYINNLDRRITVLVKSENAHFPLEFESFSKTTRQVINEAVEGGEPNLQSIS